MKQTLIVICLLISVALCDDLIVQNLNSNWKFQLTDNQTWYNADVPSTVHLDLLKNNLIPDPYYRSNLDNVRWIELKDWDYKMSFDIANSAILQKDFVNLVFEGLDTHADITLNGVALFHADNMHRKWIVDSKTYLTLKNNVLAIHFYSAAIHDQQAGDAAGNILPSNYSYSRKAAYQYGWDWGPRLVTAGIWKNVYLEGFNIRIDSTYFRTLSIQSSVANMEAWVDLLGDSGQYRIKIVNMMDLTVLADQTITYDNSSSASQVFQFSINNPILWWVRNIGQPYLYRFNVTLYKDNALIEQRQQRTGIRQLTVIQQKDAVGNGTTFMVNLNGVNVFMKGGNYIPPDMFMPRALKNPSVYNLTIQDALDANYNMIRIWGGGQFEYDIFYELCDEQGLLIWHDFMFACAMYPGSADMYDSIYYETRDNVKRLRNHPSIALWNGNNEVYNGWIQWGWQSKLTDEQKQMVWGWYVEIFQKIIPGLLSQIDPDRFYWETSPSTLIGLDLLLNFGDIHYYGVWGGAADIEDYNSYVGRFNSEYGMQGMLPFTSIKKFTNSSDWSYYSYVMELHERHAQGEYLVNYYTKTYFGLNATQTTFEKFIYLTEVMQAYAIQTAFEATRRNKTWCMGSLYWQLNDVWPVTSWSSVDYYHEWKALHYKARQMFRNIMISIYPIKAKDGTQYMAVYLVNDNILAIQGDLLLEFNTFAGDSLYTITQSITVPGSSSSVVFNITMNIYNHYTPKKSFIKTSFTPSQTTDTYTNIHYMNFTRPLNWELSTPQYSASYDLTNNKINIYASNFVKSLYIYYKDYTQSLKLSDNFLDIIPGETKSVTLLSGSLSDIQSNIKYMSLHDALKSTSDNEGKTQEIVQ